MKKIPTLFKRDMSSQPALVYDEVSPNCEWVLLGHGVATLKVDGMCTMVRDGVLYKRREVKAGKAIPAGFELVDSDTVTGKQVGWVPVGDGKEDKWLRSVPAPTANGTYEFLGPKSQGNAEHRAEHEFYPHGIDELEAPREFEALRKWLETQDIEGVVWHHEDGRCAKIKKKDFGLRRC